jgi:branched-chain amino acid aminotransferase
MTLLSFDDRDGFIWFNGEMLPWRDAKIHVLTHGLHYGSCVFEGVRVYNGKIFKLREHSERLINSAKLLGFDIPYSVAELEAAQLETIKKQGVENGYIRPVAWRGSEMMAISAQKTKIHVAIASWQWPSYFSAEARERGLRLQVSKWVRPAPNSAPTASKAAGLYMICTMSKHAAEKDGFDDALMLDYRGLLSEATGANLFLIMDGKIHTPTPDCFLNGITRQTVIELARVRGLEVIERHIKPEELANAQEVFLTGTAAEITPIREISFSAEQNYQFTMGAISKQLMADYSAKVLE